MKSKHLTLNDRIKISQMLSEQKSFKAITAAIEKNYTSVSREIRNHMVFRKTGGYGRVYNACIHRRNCIVSHLCMDCSLTNRKYYSLCDKTFQLIVTFPSVLRSFSKSPGFMPV